MAHFVTFLCCYNSCERIIVCMFLVLFITNAFSRLFEGKEMSTSRSQTALNEFNRNIGKNIQVPIVTTEDILQSPEKYLLVDVRTAEEQAISMLPNAITREEFESMHDDSILGKCIVPYCTIGLRSGNYAVALLARGFPDVKNGEGVVLYSHNSGGRDFVCNGLPTKRVHCFGKEWQEMLSEDYEGVIFSHFDFFWSGVQESMKTCKM